MASPTCVSCQDILSCEDSPLSVVGNVIGILTFASAIFLSIQVYVNAMRNAERNVFEMTDTFRSRFKEARRFDYKLKERRNLLDPEQNRDEMQHLRDAFYRATDQLAQAELLLQRLEVGSFDGPKQLWARAHFVLRQDIIKDGLDKTEKAMAELRELAAGMLSQPGPDGVFAFEDFRMEVLTTLHALRGEVSALRASQSVHEVEQAGTAKTAQPGSPIIIEETERQDDEPPPDSNQTSTTNI